MPEPINDEESHLSLFDPAGWFASVNVCLAVCVAVTGTIEELNVSVGGIGCCGPGATVGWNNAPASAQRVNSGVVCVFFWAGVCGQSGQRSTDGTTWYGGGITAGQKVGGQGGYMFEVWDWCFTTC
jgi:hypothetical protein